MIVVFAACDDEATRCSHWVAQRTRARLVAELNAAVTVLDGPAATRDALGHTLSGDAAGLAFFGHGDPDGLYAASGAVLDVHNLNLLRDRWAHAFACRAGEQLAAEAVAAGATCFAGYRSRLLLQWEPEDIPEPIRDDFVRLVTQTTLELARGVRDIALLLRAAADAQARIMAWCDDHPDEAGGLQIMAQQLLFSLVIYRRDDA